jgi:hypothetical protein
VKNLEQKLNLKLRPPSDEEIVKLGGKSFEKYVFANGSDNTSWDKVNNDEDLTAVP